MKWIILAILTIHLNAQVEAKTAHRSVADVSDCQNKIRTVIQNAVRVMGEKRKIGISSLSSSDAGKDFRDRKLTQYSTGVFIVDEGYLTNSGATVIVRSENCEVIKISVATGG